MNADSFMASLIPQYGVLINPITGKDKAVAVNHVRGMGNGLKALRENRGWTQEEAAGKFGLSVKGYIKVETGERGLKKERIEKAARIYGVSVAVILGSEPPPTPVDVSQYAGTSVLAIGRRLALIQRAVAPSLPAGAGIRASDWRSYVSGKLSPPSAAIDRIAAIAGVSRSYIDFGLPPDLTMVLFSSAARNPSTSSADKSRTR